MAVYRGVAFFKTAIHGSMTRSQHGCRTDPPNGPPTRTYDLQWEGGLREASDHGAGVGHLEDL